MIFDSTGAYHFDAFIHRLVITMKTQLGDLERGNLRVATHPKTLEQTRF